MSELSDARHELHLAAVGLSQETLSRRLNPKWVRMEAGAVEDAVDRLIEAAFAYAATQHDDPLRSRSGAGGGVTEDKTRKVTVCSDCLRACCWQGIFMCDTARGASTVEKTVAELDELDLEHADYYAAEAARGEGR